MKDLINFDELTLFLPLWMKKITSKRLQSFQKTFLCCVGNTHFRGNSFDEIFNRINSSDNKKSPVQTFVRKPKKALSTKY